MVDWIRSTLGITAPSTTQPSKTQAALAAKRDAISYDERLVMLERTQAIQLGNYEEQLQDLNVDIARAVKQPDVLRPLLVQRTQLTQEINTLKGKLANTRALRRHAVIAEANVEQALLMEQAASTMEKNTSAMEELHVEDTVDRLSDVARTMDDHNALLATPIFGASALVDDDDIDAQMAAMQLAEDEREAREADERMLMGAFPPEPKQPLQPVRAAVVGTSPVTPAASNTIVE